MAKKSRAERKRIREEKFDLIYNTMRQAFASNLSFDAAAFIAKLPSEDRGIGCLAEREIYKTLREEGQI
jgi:hypothetical protein